MKLLLIILSIHLIKSHTLSSENELQEDENLSNNQHFNDDDVIIAHSKFHPKIFGKPDPKVGTLLKKYNPQKDRRNPEELGSYLEGDMLIPPRKGRNGLLSVSMRWPDATIPIWISSAFNATEQNKIRDAFTYLHQRTCVRFVIKQAWHNDWVEITNDATGCWSSIGKLGGRQVLNLQTPACIYTTGTIVHELIHTIGFVHENSRTDRDNYIVIGTENIIPGQEFNFLKYDAAKITPFNIKYDFSSIMHLSTYAFSSNGQPTIYIYDGEQIEAIEMGQRMRATNRDILKINRMYNCKKTTLPAIKPGDNVDMKARYNLYVDTIPVLTQSIRNYLLKGDKRNQNFDINFNGNGNREEVLIDVRNALRYI